MSDKTSVKISDKRLKSCPFCGGIAKLEAHRFWCERTGRFEIGGYSVQCSENECIAKTNFVTNKGEAIVAWNTRKPIERVIEKLEERHEEQFKLYAIAFDPEDRGGYDAYSDAIKIIKEEVG